jgi:hypothetical protein
MEMPATNGATNENMPTVGSRLSLADAFFIQNDAMSPKRFYAFLSGLSSGLWHRGWRPNRATLGHRFFITLNNIIYPTQKI